MKVIKFGGSTLTSVERFQAILSYLESFLPSHRDTVIVCSALGGITDLLIQMSQQAAKNHGGYLEILEEIHNRHFDLIRILIPEESRIAAEQKMEEMFAALKDTVHGVFLVKELSPKTLDFILSFGESLSSSFLGFCLESRAICVQVLDSRNFIQTDSHFGSARVDWELSFRNIRLNFNDRPFVAIVPGFIGATADRETTTLGRGGSDYTATLIGAALGAEKVEIWTDVDGVMTADPRKVTKAFPISRLSWEEAVELSHFGTKLIFPPAMIPASKHDMPIFIRNILNPGFSGTEIGRKGASEYPVRGISSIDKIALLRIQGSGMIGVVGIAGRLFSALSRKDINVILITQASSEHSICIAVAPDQAANARKAIEQEFSNEIGSGQMDRVAVITQVSIVAVVGENMRQTPGIASRLFQALGKNGINVVAIAQGSSELNISVVISADDEAKTLNALHEAFFLSDAKSLHLFLIGTGLIGSTLLRQISEQQKPLRMKNALDIRLMGLGDIEHMVLVRKPLEIKNWQQALKHGRPMQLESYINEMLSMNLPNTVFVDCTGSDSTVHHYERILDASISIVTPNKIANSGPYSRYKILRDKALKRGVKFLYETNVGAGLPVISTLNDLMGSGDRIVKIEAILSGTLSYIFNNFTGDRKFSGIVKEAKARGLSEPDPRDDLNGLDVARKILILARETGLPLEPEDVQVENIMPVSCRKAGDVNSFFHALEKSDDEFLEKRQAALEQGQVLRYVAALELGKATVQLKGVSGAHPFYSLTGSDNMIVFTTERYQELPLVIKGPGAGAEVTAAGVFADIIRIANYLS